MGQVATVIGTYSPLTNKMLKKIETIFSDASYHKQVEYLQFQRVFTGYAIYIIIFEVK